MLINWSKTRQGSKIINFKNNIMNNQITINWNQAQQVNQEVNQVRTQKQAEALKEFLESDHELTDARDLQYYADATGKDILWLLDNGKNFNQLLKQAFLMGITIDDAINTDFQAMEQGDRENKICFYRKVYDPYSKRMLNEPIYNYEIEDYCGSYWDQLTPEDQKIIQSEFNNPI